MRYSRLVVLCLCAVLCALFISPLTALADNADIGSGGAPVELSDFSNSGPYNHVDADPWKGYLFVYVKNTGAEPWGDFHFEVYDYASVGVENVDFVVGTPYEPTSTQTGLSWVVNNTVVGATLDLYFYSDPVLPGESANFIVYTDNTTDMVNFAVIIAPSEVPEPATIAVLAIGGLLLAIRRK